MSFLTVGGVPVWVVGDGASEGAGVTVGALTPALSGAEGGAIRAEHATHRFVTEPMDAADFAALLDAASPDALAVCGGEALGGVDALYRVTLANDYVHDGYGHRHRATLTLEAA